MTGCGGGVGFLTRKDLPAKTVDMCQHIPLSQKFVISIVTHSRSFVVACVYRTPGSCSSAVLNDFLFFFGFMPFLTSAFIIFGDFNVHVDTDCINQRKLLNLLDTSNLAQNVKLIYRLPWSYTRSDTQPK